MHTPHGEAQRRALVRAAYSLIAEGGFERFRTREVAARAGVNVATLHYYFATKEDLVRAVVEYLREQFATIHLPAAQQPAETPLEELRQELADTHYYLREMPGTYVVMFELFLRALRDPAIRPIIRDLDEGWRRYLGTFIEAGVRQGAFRADLDVPAAIAILMAFIKGSVIQSLHDPEHFPAERTYAEIERWLTGPACPPTP